MMSAKKLNTLLPAAIALAILILDSATAVEGAQDGIEVCIKTVVPSLFPFIFLSRMISTSLLSLNPKRETALCRLFNIPKGTEGILLTGLLGGYPVGAKCISQAVNAGRLHTKDARRMLVFCNAAGPAFLFGITGSIFREQWIPWALWAVQLLSSYFIAKLISYTPHRSVDNVLPTGKTITQLLQEAVRTTGEICGWIILMRIVIIFIQKWLCWILPDQLTIFISGTLELSNGCISLGEIENTGLRFLFCSFFLSFGGLCVALQTKSAAPNLPQRFYLSWKLIQALISFSLAYIVQFFVLNNHENIHTPWLLVISISIILTISIYSMYKNKNSCGNLEYIGV